MDSPVELLFYGSSLRPPQASKVQLSESEITYESICCSFVLPILVVLPPAWIFGAGWDPSLSAVIVLKHILAMLAMLGILLLFLATLVAGQADNRASRLQDERLRRWKEVMHTLVVEYQQLVDHQDGYL